MHSSGMAVAMAAGTETGATGDDMGAGAEELGCHPVSAVPSLSLTERAALAGELVRLSFASLPLGLAGAALNAAVLMFVVWNHVGHPRILLWGSLFTLVSMIRLGTLRWHRRLVRASAAGALLTRAEATQASRQFLGGCWAASSVWALSSCWLFAAGSIPHQAFLAFVIAGCTAGAITTLGPIKAAFIPFSVALSVPLAVRFFETGTSLGIAMGCMTLLFLVVTVSSGIQTQRTVTEALVLRIRLARSETLMRESSELLKVGAWEMDIASGHVTWSEEVFRIHELPLGAQPSLEGAMRFFPAPARAVLRQAIEDCIAKRIPWDMEIPFVTAKGRDLWVRTVGRAVAVDGAVVGLRGSFQDMSAMKNVQVELTRAKELAEGATRAKSHFLATMSHEIRTPMNGVIGLSELLLGMELDADQRQLVQTIHASGLTLLTVINDVLDFSRIEAGRLELHARPFALAEVVEGVVRLMQPEATRKGLELRVQPMANVPGRFDGDGTRIRQILINLVGNAVKFTERGHVILAIDQIADAEIRAATGEDGPAPERALDSAGRAVTGVGPVGVTRPEGTTRIRFRVVDTGPGISEAQQRRLFQSFSQIDDGPTRQHGGSGLGLAISKQLAELMGGKIGLASRPGQGTTFSLELPLVVLPAATAISKPDSWARRGMPITGGRPAVLLVEDNLVNQLVARRHLEKLGCDVDVAPDGAAALLSWRNRPYAMIFMDLQMPGMDGLEVTRLIRAQPDGGAIPIIALTANAFAEEKQRCLDAGMNGHLPKPFSASQLSDILHQYLAS